MESRTLNISDIVDCPPSENSLAEALGPCEVLQFGSVTTLRTTLPGHSAVHDLLLENMVRVTVHVTPW